MEAKINKRLLDSIKPATKPYEVNDTELKGFLLRVQPTGLMNYYVSYRSADKRRNRVKIGEAEKNSPIQARDEAKRIFGELAKGNDPAAARKKEKALTLKAYLEQEYAPWTLSEHNMGA